MLPFCWYLTVPLEEWKTGWFMEAGFEIGNSVPLCFPSRSGWWGTGAVGLGALWVPLCRVPLVLWLPAGHSTAQSQGTAWAECWFWGWLLICSKAQDLLSVYLWVPPLVGRQRICLNSCFHLLYVAVMY